MDKNLQENMPIYMQIMNNVREAIASGELAPGERVASVRELAGEFEVNPNTMQRALNELEREGLAREIVSKVQQLRKQNDYEMMDNIRISVDADDEVKAAIEEYRDYIMKETLAVSIEQGTDLETSNINGHETGLAVERV